MQKFKYVAVNLQNQKIKGTFIAKDETDLGLQLARQSLYLVSAKPYSGNTPSAFFTLGTGKVPLLDLTTFCRQFAIMHNTHIPILDCLDILRNQSFSSYFRKILDVIYEDVKGGMVLSSALKKHEKVFPDFFYNMIYVGEMSGQLDVVLESVADYYEKESALKRKVISALSYPAVLLVMMIGILILMLGLVVPTFRDALSSLHVEITGITKVVYDVSDFLLVYWKIILVSVIMVASLVVLALQLEKGRYAFDVFKLKCPFVRKIQQNMITARFARGFGLLLSSGMDLNGAMDTIEVVLDNRYMRKKFHDAAESVRHGMSLTLAVEAYKLFPPMMNQMINIGERSASLDDVLTRSCGFFDNEVETSLNSITSKIQPIMLGIMGAMIGTLFIAVYSPMLSIMNGL